MIFMKWTDLKQDIDSISQEEKDLIELTALLAHLRKNKNITQEELAAKVNVTQAQIARVENYSYTPTLKTITKIASGLDLKLVFVDKLTNEVVKN
jgi:transcriptional regulator with XRE-family HTH domain